MSKYLLALSLLALCHYAKGGTCPTDPKTIAPCTCNGAAPTTITCIENDTRIDLDNVFKVIMSGHLPGQQAFDTFILMHSSVENLPSYAFHGVSFIHLNFTSNTKLNCVHPRAFTGLENTLVTFSTYDTSFATFIGDKCNLFWSLQFVNTLTTISIIDSDIEEIGSTAFYGGSQASITSIVVRGQTKTPGALKKIGKTPFNWLRNLQTLDLSNNQIQQIGPFAFELSYPVDCNNPPALTIDLSRNKFADKTFTDSIFDLGDRNVRLLIKDSDSLKYLNEKAFRPFFRDRVKASVILDITNTPLEYYQDNAWIIQNKRDPILLDTKIVNGQTVDGKDIWQTDASEFTKSRNIDQTTTMGYY